MGLGIRRQCVRCEEWGLAEENVVFLYRNLPKLWSQNGRRLADIFLNKGRSQLKSKTLSACRCNFGSRCAVAFWTELWIQDTGARYIITIKGPMFLIRIKNFEKKNVSHSKLNENRPVCRRTKSIRHPYYHAYYAHLLFGWWMFSSSSWLTLSGGVAYRGNRHFSSFEIHSFVEFNSIWRVDCQVCTWSRQQ